LPCESEQESLSRRLENAKEQHILMCVSHAAKRAKYLVGQVGNQREIVAESGCACLAGQVLELSSYRARDLSILSANRSLNLLGLSVSHRQTLPARLFHKQDAFSTETRRYRWSGMMFKRYRNP
jgi:hypothetical protein